MSDEPVKLGTETEKLHYCDVHKNPCEKCPTCTTYSYCPTCEKCYEPNCPGS